MSTRDIAWKATTGAGIVGVRGKLPFDYGTFHQLGIADLLEDVRDERAVLSKHPVSTPRARLDGARSRSLPDDLAPTPIGTAITSLGGSDAMLPELAESAMAAKIPERFPTYSCS